MQRYVLNSEEIATIQKLVAEIAAKYGSAEDPDFLLEASVLAHELPRGLRAALNSFRLTEPVDAAFCISGYPVNDEKIGPTPEHWDLSTEDRKPTLEEEILFVLTGSLLGDPIGWRTQQHGRIVHDVMPVKGMELEQIGIGSEQLIWWHTEDAFHPLRGDYIGLMFLRNPDRVPTTMASLERLPELLDPEDYKTLFEPHYTILPDKSHRPENAHAEAHEDLDEHTFDRIQQMQQEPDKIPLLSGDRKSPYIQIDPYFMEPVKDNPRAQRAFEALCKVIDTEIRDVALEAGDICFLDNYKAVHGRRPFKARYDGRDRWFKRMNIARDLRKSRTDRQDSASRVIL
jgi:Fe(II)/alpha-ketoglutarate-dependent arginine beta-hydroxylase